MTNKRQIRRSGYPFDSGNPKGLWSGSIRGTGGGDDGAVCGRFHCHCLLGEPVEQLASATRLTPVEAEGEFVQVVLQVLFADRSLMCAEKPAFQQRDDSVAAAAVRKLVL